MLAPTLSILALAAVAVSAAFVPVPASNQTVFRPFENIDPNTLSCDPAGQIFLLLPHFTDCAKFFMCANGAEVEFICPADLIFDFELQGCNWKADTTCVLRDYDIEGSGMEPGEEIIGMYGEEAENGPLAILTAESSGTVRPISAIAAQQFNGILNCNRADSSARQLPYRSDCQRYWKCVSGVPQVVYCSDGLFFNQNTQQCDFEANVRCAIDPVDELTGEYLVYE